MKRLNQISLVLFPYLLTIGSGWFYVEQSNFLGSVFFVFAVFAWVVAIGHFFRSIYND